MEESPFSQNQNLSKEKEEYFYENQIMNLYIVLLAILYV